MSLFDDVLLQAQVESQREEALRHAQALGRRIRWAAQDLLGLELVPQTTATHITLRLTPFEANLLANRLEEAHLKAIDAGSS